MNGTDEIVPDSEEDSRPVAYNASDVIEISSDEGEVVLVTPKKPRGTREPTRAKFRTPCARRVVLSSSSEASDSEEQIPALQPEIIDLSESPPLRPKPLPASHTKPNAIPRFESLYADDSDDYDGSIMVLNDPKSARKPIKRIPLTKTTALRGTKKTFPLSLFDDGAQSPVSPLPSHISLSPPSTPSSSRGSGRTSKKSEIAAEQEKREQYAKKLFAELNQTVFKNGIPVDTKLIWNTRLLSTAGRAKWHRNRDGVETSEIELATKILDCNERIRNTLSHEMAHLASWIINKNPKEGHGKIWKTWAANVMKARPEIHISTKHNYEITYPFEWKCEGCSKTYGRFSKSIKPDECVCGACKTGRLLPMFTTRAAPKTPKASALGRMAAGKTRESPISALSRLREVELSAPNPAHRIIPGSFELCDDDSDIDIELVAFGIAKIRL